MRRRYQDGTCGDCGRRKSVTLAEWWESGFRMMLCADCIRPYRPVLLDPLPAWRRPLGNAWCPDCSIHAPMRRHGPYIGAWCSRCGGYLTDTNGGAVAWPPCGIHAGSEDTCR